MLINAKGVKVAVLNDSSNSYNTTAGAVSTMDFSVGGNNAHLDISHFFEVGFGGASMLVGLGSVRSHVGCSICALVRGSLCDMFCLGAWFLYVWLRGG